MSKGSGGGSDGGRTSYKTGEWVNYSNGRERVGIIIGKPISVNGETVHPFSYSARQGSRSHWSDSGNFNPKTGISRDKLGRQLSLGDQSRVERGFETAKK